MTDDTTTLILGYMRRFERTLADTRAEVRDLRAELCAATERLALLETGLDTAEGRMAGMGDRLARLERRLELAGA